MRVVPVLLRSLAVVLMAFATGLGVSHAQVTETRGTMSLIEGRRYMVAFPQVWASASETPNSPAMMLWVSSRSKAKIRVETPAVNSTGPEISRNYDLQPNQILQIPISTALMNTLSESRDGFGIYVTGDKPISVFTYQSWTGNGELARHLPTEAWGKNYYTMNFYQDRYGIGEPKKYRPSQILIIAEKDNTVVTYTPTFDTEGGRDTPPVPKGVPNTVTLERGETFLIKSKIDESQNREWTTDLSGTWIRASKNIGVVSGHTKVAIMRYPDALPPGGYAAEAHFVRNNVHDAMLPIEMGGKSFVTIPSMYTSLRITGQAPTDLATGIEDDKGDVVRVIALEDNTTVKAMRSDGSGLKNMWKINRGETRLLTALEVATYWESDKPILMGQYGKSWAKVTPYGMDVEKDGDATQGYPTINAGMPMLEYVPPTDRWVSYGTFKSPEGMDNFLNIALKIEDIGKIKVDGKALNSAFGGSVRPLAGTPYSFIRTPVSPGDHVIESVSDNIKWVAWTYGSLDGIKQGRAYGTPVSIDLAIPCPDSLTVTETLVCGDVTGIGQIVPENIACGSIFAVYAEELSNYELIVDEAFSSGDKKVSFWVNVLDKTQDASATVRVVTRSGKYVEKTYTYEADKIAWDPASINFGVIPFNTPVTKEYTITNKLTTRPVTVKELRAKYFPNVYTISPSSFTIPAGGSQKVAVTANINDAREKIDTIIAVLGCFEQNTVELIVRGEEPLIYVGDQTWTNIPVSAGGVEKDVVIQNGSDVELIITGFDQSLLPASNDGVAKFYNPVNLTEKLPIKLGPNEKHIFSVTYNPQGEAGVEHRVDVPFYSNAVRVDSIAVLIGNGVKIQLAAAAEPWNVRVIDNIQTNQGITEYPQQVKFSNYGSQSVEFSQPFIRGTDASAFRITDIGNVGSFPIQLIGGGTNQTRYITVAFVPTELPNRAAERNNYDAELVFPTNSTESAEITVKLIGTAWQPQVKGADYNFGSFQTGAPAVVATIPITNDNYKDASNPTTGDTKGTRNVVVTDIRWSDPNDPDNARFQFSGTVPTPAAPWRIGNTSGDEEQLKVTFNPTMSGTFTANYDIITEPADMTDGAAPYVATYTLTAVVSGGEFSVTNAYAEQYVFLKKDMFITVKHDEATPKRFKISLPTGNDAARFTVVDPVVDYIDVPAGQEGIIRVEFIPDYVTKMKPGQTQQWLTDKGNPAGVSYRGNMFESDIVFTDESNNKTQTARLTGDGIYLETTESVGSNYNVKVGESIDIDVNLKPDPESINQPQLREMRVRLLYDGKLIRPSATVQNPILLDGTLMQGWEIRSFSQASANMFEIDFAAGATGQPLVDDPSKPLFRVKFDAFLATSANPSAKFESPLTPFMYWVDVDASGDDKRYVVIRDVPGKVTVTLDCAGQLRLVNIGSARYGVKPVAPNPVSGTAVINYSIGINARTSIVLMNSNGDRILDLVDENQQSGEYELTVDVSKLPAGVYYYQVISGPYTSEPQRLVVIR